MTTYSHGGDVEAFAKKVGCSVDEVIDLSSNIHFDSPDVQIDLKRVDFKTYPKYDELYQSLAKHYTTNKDEIEVFNGGSSAIFTLMRELKNKECYIYSPAYVEYKKAANINGKDITLINRLENIDTKVNENSIVVFVNPSTPDGKLYDLKKLIEYWKSKNCTVIIDESFLEFTDAQSIVGYIKSYDKLYILKSLTKFYGCAGVRCGMVVSCKENILKLKKNEPLWKISHFDSIYIQKMLEDKNYKEKTLKDVVEAKEYLKEVLKKSDVFESFSDSSANFFLVKLNKLSAKEFQKNLEPFKIMVRDCSNFDFLDDSYVRIAVKSKKDIKSFEKALDSIQ